VQCFSGIAIARLVVSAGVVDVAVDAFLNCELTDLEFESGGHFSARRDCLFTDDELKGFFGRARTAHVRGADGDRFEDRWRPVVTAATVTNRLAAIRSDDDAIEGYNATVYDRYPLWSSPTGCGDPGPRD
jgi:hypothetical protein